MLAFRRALVLPWMVGFTLSSGCGDSATSDAGGGNMVALQPCEELAKRVCDEARACAPDTEANSACGYAWSGGQSRRDCGVCEGGLEALFCGDSTKTAAQIQSCADVLTNPTCEEVGDGRRVVVLPAACDEAVQCNAGSCLD